MNKFSEYMWYLIHYPLKAKKYASDLYILFTVLGSIFDDFKSAALEVHKQGNISTATGRYLDICGKDRNMPRVQGEDDERYRKRLLMKVEIAKRAGTKAGLEMALEALGYETELQPLYTIDSERWAEFYIYFYENDDKPVIYDFEMIKQTVMELKQASSKPNYGFRYNMSLSNDSDWESKLHIITSIRFYYGEPLLIDGSWDLNEEYLLNGIKSGLSIKENFTGLRITTPIENKSLLTGEITMITSWYLDGEVSINGERRLNSGIWKECLN